MSDDEKILLIKVLLLDIRGNWGDYPQRRANKAYELSKELYKSTKDENWDKLCDCIAKYDGDDGRYFRSVFPNGYEGMEKLHKTSQTYKDKSTEFKKIVDEYITFPEYRFEDYED